MSYNDASNRGDTNKVRTGVQAWSGSGAYYDDTTLGSFTVSRAGEGYVKGVRVVWAGGQTVTGMTAGNCYCIYMDSTGTIGKIVLNGISEANYQDLFANKIPLFQCMRDSVTPTNNQITCREDHPWAISATTSVFLHHIIGPVIRNADKGANIVLNGTKKIQIDGQDYLEDHGLITTIPDSSSTGVTFRKMYTDAAGKWCIQNTNDTFAGYYNNAGTPTVLGGSKFGVYTLYVGKDTATTTTPQYYAVLDVAQYNNVTAAQTAINNGANAQISNEFYPLELAQLGTIIFDQAGDAITRVNIAKMTLKSTVSTSGTNSAILVNTDVTAFDGILSSADTNVQAALRTIDDWGKTTTDHSLLLGNGTGVAIGSLGVATNGQLPIGSSGADPSLATLTAGTNVTVTNGAGSITLSKTIETINDQTDSYQLVSGDAGKFITMTKGSANTLTVPKDATVNFAVGTYIYVYQGGAGVTTLAPEDGAITINSVGGNLDISAQYGVAKLVKIAANLWVAFGDLA